RRVEGWAHQLPAERDPRGARAAPGRRRVLRRHPPRPPGRLAARAGPGRGAPRRAGRRALLGGGAVVNSVTGVVTANNGKAIQLEGSHRWLLPARGAGQAPPALPAVGERVTVELDAGGFVRGVAP